MPASCGYLRWMQGVNLQRVRAGSETCVLCKCRVSGLLMKVIFCLLGMGREVPQRPAVQASHFPSKETAVSISQVTSLTWLLSRPE